MKIKLIVAVAALAMGIAAGAASMLLDKSAPEVRFTALSGESFKTSELRGKVVLVNFWATSCASCVSEMPRMVETYNRFAPRGYEMVAVAMSYDHPNQVAAFAQKRALPFKVALDSGGEIARRFGEVRATPTTFVVDKRGRIIERYLGEPDWTRLHALLDKALDAPG